MKVLAIVPARGGSKGIPGKNLKLLGSKPLIAYPIQEVQNSNLDIELVVSTDDTAIADLASRYNARVIMRPLELGSDSSPVIDSVIHVLNQFKEEGVFFDVVVLLQPTSPFWKSKDLENVIGLLDDPNCDGVISVCPSPEAHPARMYSVDNPGFLRPLQPDGEVLRRQDLPTVYLRNGCFYAVKSETILKEKTLMPSNKKAYVMDPKWFLTIDTPRDLKLAGILADEWETESNS